MKVQLGGPTNENRSAGGSLSNPGYKRIAHVPTGKMVKVPGQQLLLLVCGRRACFAKDVAEDEVL